ncbi:hypothetical protein CEXT_79841 [Caerostris extrusa]|uniref:Uncharacterized protein n=1 Tax=Caerostris extrusa TaxID=172846 RepID=A0AAV4XGG0_CAEEX|nr:hypothetical protein CEXT_79841 [Caerostris extrusa]
MLLGRKGTISELRSTDFASEKERLQESFPTFCSSLTHQSEESARSEEGEAKQSDRGSIVRMTSSGFSSDLSDWLWNGIIGLISFEEILADQFKEIQTDSNLGQLVVGKDYAEPFVKTCVL